MENDNIKELSKHRFDKALSNYDIAKELYDDGHYAYALNRAYYAIFNAMRAVNALDGFDSSKHSGVIAHFNQEYVKTGKVPASSSGIIRKASMLREKSDYEDFYEPDAEDVAETILQIRTLLNDIKNYLMSKEVDID